MDIALLIAIVAVPLWLNVKATLLVWRDSFCEKPQKVAQLLFVWFVPLVGAIVVWGVHRRDEKPSGTYPAEKDPGDDFAVSRSPLRTITEVADGD
jgi:hypothetical protein